jgi:hypothetical protein
VVSFRIATDSYFATVGEVTDLVLGGFNIAGAISKIVDVGSLAKTLKTESNFLNFSALCALTRILQRQLGKLKTHVCEFVIDTREVWQGCGAGSKPARQLLRLGLGRIHNVG